jgi:hypothetical protein
MTGALASNAPVSTVIGSTLGSPVARSSKKDREYRPVGTFDIR